ncbi:hypothetical protein BX264_3581 [Streptomyces sp. 2333.5]|nr:hypothetical protein BX264_3581 [Streptomyces sp. 2333.5]SED53254.1 hypothetical protein SAMN05428943_3828 [Streptomyces sp. 2314.4]SEE35651.1 hypothetical protein SAMN05428942_3683 [Streptomyces sp. 2112.2]
MPNAPGPAANHGLALDLVARHAGLGTGTSLRQHLHSAVGVIPQAYRRTCRNTAVLTA